MQAQQLELQNRLEQQLQSYLSLTEKMHAVVLDNENKTKELEGRSHAYASLTQKMHDMEREHVQKTKEMDEASQMALEETLSEVDSLNRRLNEAQAQLLEKGSSIDSIKVTVNV